MLAHRYTIGLYASYLLYYFVAEFLVNDLTPRVFGADNASLVVTVYWLSITCVAAGLASFYFLNRLVSQLRRRWLLLAACAANLLLLAALVMAGRPAYYLAAVMGFMLTAGYTGGAVHYVVALQARDKQYTGRIVGMAIAAAVTLQYLLQTIGKFSGYPIFWQAGTSALALTCAVYLLKAGIGGEMAFSEYPVEQAQRQFPPRGYKLLLIAIVALLNFMHGMNDGILVRLHAEAAIDLTDSPRWFYAVGVLLAGALADYRQRRYLAVGTLAAMMGCMISIVLLGSVQTYWFSSSATYFLSGFLAIFFTVVFLDLAPWTRQLALWACMGRILRFAFAGIGAVMGEWVWRVMALNTIITAYTLILMLLLLLVFHIRFLEDNVQAAAEPEKTTGHAMDDYKARYALTPRETQVLALILEGRAIKEIAMLLGIAERTTKDHIAHILAKTETKNQKELLVLLHKEN